MIINGVDVNDLTIEASVKSTGMTFEEQRDQDEKVRHLLRAGNFEQTSYGWRWFPEIGSGHPSLGKTRDVLKAFREAGFKVSAKMKCGTYRMEHSKNLTSEQIQESMEKVQNVDKMVSLTPTYGGFKKGMMAVFKCTPAFSVKEIK